VKKIIFCVVASFIVTSLNAQVKWKNFDSLYQPLPASMHIYRSTELLDGKPNIMYYAIVDAGDKSLKFTTDTALKRRLTPTRFYQKNNEPVLVVNCSFFSFATNQNLNVVVKNGKILSYNKQTQEGRGKDTLTYLHSFLGALGITKKRKIDIAWTFTDSSKKNIYASQYPAHFFKDSVEDINVKYINKRVPQSAKFSRWNVKTAIGGGPVLIQDNEIKISNNEERKFAGKAGNNPEPRTAIGYTKDNKLVVLVCEGRSDTAAGLSLIQLAKILKDIGCVEALNLDGGGSTCMLINGKETNTPSGKGVQRPVPSVFLIERNK
jgi:exopolysaccharide biosynthesis protein